MGGSLGESRVDAENPFQTGGSKPSPNREASMDSLMLQDGLQAIEDGDTEEGEYSLEAMAKQSRTHTNSETALLALASNPAGSNQEARSRARRPSSADASSMD
eukprot:gene3334-4191_t